MNSIKRERWSQTRELGKQRFILRFGVLQWGITTGVCFWLLRTWREIGSGGYVEQLSSNLGGLVSGVLIFSVVGALFGLITWNNLEKQFLATQGEEEELDASKIVGIPHGLRLGLYVLISVGVAVLFGVL